MIDPLVVVVMLSIDPMFVVARMFVDPMSTVSVRLLMSVHPHEDGQGVQSVALYVSARSQGKTLKRYKTQSMIFLLKKFQNVRCYKYVRNILRIYSKYLCVFKVPKKFGAELNPVEPLG